jgi:hypothetical protein
MYSHGAEVQIGEYDVPASVLEAPGGPLNELIGDEGAATVDTMMGPPPTDGWRIIVGDLNRTGGQSAILAAPWVSASSNGWMVVRFNYRAGKWRAIIELDGRPVRPSRADRRSGLSLDWAKTPMSGRVGSVPELRTVLRNTAGQAWCIDDHDSGLVSAWLLGPNGERSTSGLSLAIGYPAVRIACLDVGASVELTAYWHTRGIDQLPAGEYFVEAELPSLKLRCPSGVLTLS